MKKKFVLGFLLLLSLGVFAQNSQTRHTMNNYQKQWEQVDKFEGEDLPKSATKIVDEVLKDALKNGNTQQAIKALIYKNKYKLSINDQENTEIFTDLENLLDATTRKEEKALLNSMLAELYLNYLDASFWEISQRTSISDFVPKDIKEWSKNIFQDKALLHLAESVKNQSQLLSVNTDLYSDIINIGVDSERLFPTLSDFIFDRAINQSKRVTSGSNRNNAFQKSLNQKKIEIRDLALPTDDFLKLDFAGDDNLITLQYYQNFLQSLLDRGLNESIVLTEINRNNYLSNCSENYRSKYAYDFLLNLEKRNQQNDYNVEVVYALINQLQLNRYSSYFPNRDEVANEKTGQIYDWCKYGIEKYPNYKRINILRERLSRLEDPYARISGQSVYHPENKNKKLNLSYRNLQEATVKLIDTKTNKEVYSQKIKLSPQTTYLEENIDFDIDVNKVGNYILRVDYDKLTYFKDNDNSLKLIVSELANFARVSGEDEYEFYVVDRIKGTPIKDAVVTIYSTDWGQKKYDKIASIQTDAKGIALFNAKKYPFNGNDQRYVYKVTKGLDNALPYTDFPYYHFYNSAPSSGTDIISIFTDRSIYRPGQTVYFKAVSSKQLDSEVALPNVRKEYDVMLYNANNQLVSEKKLSTNDFGSLAGEFVLPQGGLNGQYQIRVGNGTQYFSVEEYKRPTFQVTFDKLEGTYTFGDKVKIVGRAENFSGIKLQGATVDYNITRNPMMRWMYSPSENVDNGTIVTKEDGSFEIAFSIPENDTKKSWFNSVYNFSVQATITDQNGETQSGNFDFVVGDVSMLLDVNMPSTLDKESNKQIKVQATNLSGEAISAKGTYTLSRVLANDSIKEKIQVGDFSTDSSFDLMPLMKELPSAKYLLSLKAKDDKGRDVVSEKYFILYSPNDKKPPIETNEWFVEKQLLFDKSQDAEIILGVSAKDATILYDLIKDMKVFSREYIKLSDSNKKLLIPYKEEYGDNVTASFTYVIDEVSYSKQIELSKKKESKDLNIKFEVFRDKLRPGDHEEWRISVKDNVGKPAFAELLASMYDSSLDQLRSPNVWNLNKLTQAYNYPSLFNTQSFGTNQNYYSFRDKDSYTIDLFKWDYLEWFGFSFDRYTRMLNQSRSVTMAAKPKLQNTATTSFDESVALSEPLVLALSSSELEENKSIAVEPPLPEDNGGNLVPQIRSNFNETAFFYPQLKTDENGETIISFTVPESNTTWKFRALAYDKDLNVGKLEALAVSRKELMVTPNMPRFIREGDKTSISTKISNLSDQSLDGKVRIEFFNPLTDEAIELSIANQYQNFSLQKEASTSASWLFDVPSGIDMIGVRIVAETASFSDGEQHALPVLPNRMLVTESMTMNINGIQTKNFSFDKFVNSKSKTLSNYRLTLEYSGNPAWYAVQALPTLSNPTNENAVNWFASYYVNTLGTSITKQYPKVSNMIKQWTQQGGNKETLVSKLQKNEELKAVLLEETPWVLDAKTETEQMERLSLLFDLNNTNMKTNQAIDKLEELQNQDGGWSWYKGMYSSRSITQYVLYGFFQLVDLGAVEYPSNVKEMQIKALTYLDTQIRKDYEDLKKANKEWQKITGISTNQLEYIYVRSNYRDIPIDVETREAERFYTSVAEKYWTSLNLYEQSLLAVVSLRNGNKALTEKIMKSLRERATVNDEMGMFWANNKSQVFMSQSAVAVHTFLMEAFRETKASIEEMDLLKQWLLKQKQTQVWESTHATIDAIYALLSTGNDWLTTTDDSKVIVAGQVIESSDKEIGTGYIEQSWSGDQIKKDLGKIEIQKTTNGPAWGAMYWQYYEDLDKITAQDGALKLSTKLFVEKSTNTGKTLVEVTDKNPLKVGDKVVVRLTVRTDRDMEFVSIKDMRGSCFEPIETLSGLKWQNAIYYYQSTKDASTNFYFDNLPKGTYVFEYPVYVNRVGDYSNGISTIQCIYAPEFVSQTAGVRVVVK